MVVDYKREITMGYTERLIDDIEYKENILKHMKADLLKWPFGDEYWYELKERHDKLSAIIAALKQKLLTCDNTAIVETFGKITHDALKEHYPSISYKTVVDRRNFGGAVKYEYLTPLPASVLFLPTESSQYTFRRKDGATEMMRVDVYPPVELSNYERHTVDVILWQDEIGKRYRMAYCDKIDTLVWSE